MQTSINVIALAVFDCCGDWYIFQDQGELYAAFLCMCVKLLIEQWKPLLTQ